MPYLSGKLDAKAGRIPHIEMLRCYRCGLSESATRLHPHFVAICQLCGRVNLEVPIHKAHPSNGKRRALNMCSRCEPDVSANPVAQLSPTGAVMLCDTCDVFTAVSRAAMHRERVRNALAGRSLCCVICGGGLIYALHRSKQEGYQKQIVCRECENEIRGLARVEADHPLGRVVAPDYTELLPGNLNQAFSDAYDGGILRFQNQVQQLRQEFMRRVGRQGETAPAPTPSRTFPAQRRRSTEGRLTVCAAPQSASNGYANA
jgi:hypothetical protein